MLAVPEESSDASKAIWTEEIDTESGERIWVNVKTGDVSMVKPDQSKLVQSSSASSKTSFSSSAVDKASNIISAVRAKRPLSLGSRSSLRNKDFDSSTTASSMNPKTKEESPKSSKTPSPKNLAATTSLSTDVLTPPPTPSKRTLTVRFLEGHDDEEKQEEM